MKITTKQITTTAVLLAICIVSQFFKNTSVYITGPIINACLIIAALGAGMACGIILSVITPVTSFLITGSPIMSAIPAIIPCVMIGNIILVVAVSLIAKKIKESGYPRPISGSDVYDDICDQIEGKENGSYVVLSKFDDDVIFEYHITVMDDEFNLGVLTMRTPEGVFEADFDA